MIYSLIPLQDSSKEGRSLIKEDYRSRTDVNAEKLHQYGKELKTASAEKI